MCSPTISGFFSRFTSSSDRKSTIVLSRRLWKNLLKLAGVRKVNLYRTGLPSCTKYSLIRLKCATAYSFFLRFSSEGSCRNSSSPLT